ncbi:MAG: S9 family peptidase [Deltaproteobacteria bacterium]|nr:S9 family peptidase [Deltaproteobacteria bacterium]
MQDARARPGLPELIPREVLLGNPERAQPQVSPDGKRIAFLAPTDGVLNIWVQTLGRDDARAVTRDAKRGIRVYFWAEDSQTLLYLQDAGGDENWQLHRVDPQSGQDSTLTPAGVRAGIVATSPRLPDQVLVSTNERDKTVFDVYRLDLKTGEMREDVRNPGNVLGWIADLDLRVRAALAMDADAKTQLLVRDDPDSAWRTLVSWSPLEEGSPVAFSADGESLLVADNKTTDMQRLYSMKLATGEQTEIFHDPKAEFIDGLVHPTERVVQAVASERLRKKWTVLDERVQRDFKILRALQRDDFSVVSRSRDDGVWVVATEADRTGQQYYIYYREQRRVAFLFDTRPKLRRYQLAAMQPLEIPTRDGLRMVSYLTRPTWAGEGEKLPLVLFVHGGPWGRDSWTYHPYVQWLANRGYAVLQVNFRGSAGFGKDFLNAGNKEWGRKMQHDLEDAVKWAIASACADPERIGILGGSYGGYAVLAGVTFTPDLYAVAVDIVGPSNIVTLLESVPPYWKPMLALFQVRVGDLKADREMLEARSPLHFAERIRTPLIIFQGANDPRVKQAESDQIVKAIRDRGGRVDYVVYADEGHGFARPPNRLDFIGRAERFLAEQLGGRLEPFTPPEGSTADQR